RALVERAGLGRRCVRPRPRTSRSRHPERHQCGGNRLPHINPEDSEEVNDDSGGTATVVTYREDSVSARDQVWFARDSPLEGDGFELSVPGREPVKPSWEKGLLSGCGSEAQGIGFLNPPICWGTESSNPSPSRRESANFRF